MNSMLRREKEKASRANECFHCGQHGNRLSAYQKKDADMMKGKGKMKGFSEGKNPPQQQQQYGKGKGWYWSESWSET